MIQLSLFFAVLIPFFYPGMMERAGLVADVLALIYGIMVIKRWWIALLQVLISYGAYSCYFRGSSVIPMSVYALCGIIVMGVLAYDSYREICED